MISRTIIAMLFLATICGVSYAGPVAVYASWNGKVVIEGLTGEIGFAFRAPEAKLFKANAPNSSGAVTVDKGTDGEIAAANFGGFQGTFDLGYVAQAHIPSGELEFFVQYDFVNSRVFHVSDGISPAVGGLYYATPEPSSLVLTSIGLFTLPRGRRRTHRG